MSHLRACPHVHGYFSLSTTRKQHFRSAKTDLCKTPSSSGGRYTGVIVITGVTVIVCATRIAQYCRHYDESTAWLYNSLDENIDALCLGYHFNIYLHSQLYLSLHLIYSQSCLFLHFFSSQTHWLLTDRLSPTPLFLFLTVCLLCLLLHCFINHPKSNSCLEFFFTCNVFSTEGEMWAAGVWRRSVVNVGTYWSDKNQCRTRMNPVI